MAQTVLGRMEARARREGALSALQRASAQVLRSRFPDAPVDLVERIERVRDPNRLEESIGQAATAASLSEIERLLGAPPRPS